MFEAVPGADVRTHQARSFTEVLVLTFPSHGPVDQDLCCLAVRRQLFRADPRLPHRPTSNNSRATTREAELNRAIAS